MSTPSIKLGALFRDVDLAKAQEIVQATKGGRDCVDRLEKEVVVPRMGHIDFVTGQENLPTYFAYLLLHLLT